MWGCLSTIFSLPPPTFLKIIALRRQQSQFLSRIIKRVILGGAKGFCQVKKNPKIREKLGSGRVGQASIRICLFFLKFCVFLCCFLAVYVSKKRKKSDRGGGWIWSDQSEFFSFFLIFFNLTKPLILLQTTANYCQDFFLLNMHVANIHSSPCICNIENISNGRSRSQFLLLFNCIDRALILKNVPIFYSNNFFFIWVRRRTCKNDLPIGIGRYTNIPRQERFCTLCD